MQKTGPHLIAATEPAIGQLALVGRTSLISHHPVVADAAPSRRWLHTRRLPAILAAGDVLSIVVAAALCGLVQGLEPPSAAAISLLVPMLVVLAVGHHRRSELVVSHNTLEELPALVQVPTLAALVLGGTADLFADVPPSMATLWTFWLVTLALLVVLRIGVRRLITVAGAPERALLIGDPVSRERFRRHLATAPLPLVQLVAELDIPELGRGDDDRLTVEQLVERHEAERVFVLPSGDADRAAQVARRARNAGVTVTLSPQTIESIGAHAHVEQVGGTVLLTAMSSRPAPRARCAKRALDVTGAGLGLLVLSPLLALVAAAIKLDSRGPVLFRQVRVGRDGRRFEICKFRTMDCDAEARKDSLRAHNETSGLFKMAADPRVTRVGRVLRRTAIDELPQLLNVLRGDMALVGPRPLVCDEDELVEGWHRDRLRVRPGMTGPWQVLGSARIPLNDMVALDHQYAANWSVWTDLQILLRTAVFVCTRRGL
jgi:exopolysaccharide biosynthesis polyprenyl glycosylphosphotransferase